MMEKNIIPRKGLRFFVADKAFMMGQKTFDLLVDKHEVCALSVMKSLAVM